MTSEHPLELLFECYGLGVVEYDSRRQYPTARCLGLRTRPPHPPSEFSGIRQKDTASPAPQEPECLNEQHGGPPTTKPYTQEGLARRARHALFQSYAALYGYYTRFARRDAKNLTQQPERESLYPSNADNGNPPFSRSAATKPFLLKTDYCLGRTTVYASKLQSPQCLGLHLSVARHTNVVNPSVSQNYEVEPITMEQRPAPGAQTSVAAGHRSLTGSITDDADDSLDEPASKAVDTESAPATTAVSLTPVFFAQRVGLIATQVGQPLYRHIILRPREASRDTLQRAKAIYERSAELLRRSTRILFSFTASPVELSTHTTGTAPTAKSSSSSRH